jgi:hypothetical protein
LSGVLPHQPRDRRTDQIGRRGDRVEGDRGDTGSNETPLVCDVTLPTSCNDPTIGYADIAPILEQRCLSCHRGTPGGPWPLTSYEHVASWANEIRGQVSACAMPPADAGSTMTDEERDRLLLWVRCGAPK